jgi:hypothetical protein
VPGRMASAESYLSFQNMDNSMGHSRTNGNLKKFRIKPNVFFTSLYGRMILS